ncbi:MAG TPA: nickel-binding protein [Chthoniobacterales bacterium]|nr:nickel-binding protein [Chthoniobacterales bacterium]HXY61008.1 nickel-binding protein [Chthoniobacterales bacterium]
MPAYMDIHEIPGGVTADAIAKAHEQDVKIQSKYGVCYHKYWVNEKAGKVFCLCHAPNAEAAAQVHREAHGQAADKIIQVEPEVADLFLGGSEVNDAGAVLLPGVEADARDPGIRTILFTDIVGSTSLTQRIGDEAAMEILYIHDKIVRDALGELGGREIKHLGDGIMASFVSAASAVKCATRVQRDVTKHGTENVERSIKVRVGVAAGEPVERHDDLFGCTVQLAARLCSHAQPEQILVSNVVAELCQGKILPFEEIGDVVLKGFEQPVRVHAVSWSSEATTV